MYLLFDIGGTNMRFAVSKDGKNLSDIQTHTTPKRYQESMELIARIASEISEKGKIHAAAGGIAGPMNIQKTKLVHSPNLPNWNQKLVKKYLEKIFGAPVYLENDAALAGLGEATHGAGKKYSIVAYITISTGVNGVRIVEGKIDINAYGFEIGKQIIDVRQTIDSRYEIPGHLESYISGAALAARFGKPAQELKKKELWDEIAGWLSCGIVNTILYWSPEIIVIGGSVMKSIPLSTLNSYLQQASKIVPQLPPVKLANLRDASGLWGALEYLKQYRRK